MTETNTPETNKLMRLSQVLKLIPVGKSTWWAGVKTGRFPQSYKLSERITVWKRSDIIALMDRVKAGERL